MIKQRLLQALVALGPALAPLPMLELWLWMPESHRMTTFIVNAFLWGIICIPAGFAWEGWVCEYKAYIRELKAKQEKAYKLLTKDL